MTTFLTECFLLQDYRHVAEIRVTDRDQPLSMHRQDTPLSQPPFVSDSQELFLSCELSLTEGAGRSHMSERGKRSDKSFKHVAAARLLLD